MNEKKKLEEKPVQDKIEVTELEDQDLEDVAGGAMIADEETNNCTCTNNCSC